MTKKELPIKYILKGILTLGSLGIALWLYPGYLAHGYTTSETNSAYSIFSEVLIPETTAEQFFVPQDTRLDVIQIDLLFDEERASGSCRFLLKDENGEVLAERDLAFADMESGRYYDVEIGKTVDTDKTYSWELIFPEDMDFNCQVVYSETVGTIAQENQYLLLNGELISADSQMVCQYSYLSHPDKADIVGKYWISVFLVYLVLMELIDRVCMRMRKPGQKSFRRAA